MSIHDSVRAILLATSLVIPSAGTELPQSVPQKPCPRILAQDASLDNLVDPPGYRCAALGTLGGVQRAGHGKQALILIPGLGFGAGIFDEFLQRHAEEFRMYAVTLAGFAGTSAPPSPGATTSFGAQTWTNAALDAIEHLIADEHIERPIVAGHWLGGTQIALRLAARHPQEVKAVVLFAGSAAMTTADPQRAAQIATLERRAAVVDQYMAPKWFKTVTRETWDDNNFLPGDYARDPVRGLRLWRAAATPPLHVWVRYLCEFNAQDVTLELRSPAVPTLLLQPDLEGLPREPGEDYMLSFCASSWARWLVDQPKFSVKLVLAARACPWIDQPEQTDGILREFLASLR